ncbi:MAG: hypothetical protein FWD16_07485, partial [Clostridia bacterium]|nr:hypothetical protein [Clostridia bacterium]
MENNEAQDITVNDLPEEQAPEIQAEQEAVQPDTRPILARVSSEYVIQTLALAGAAALFQVLAKVMPSAWFVAATLVNIALCVAVLRVGFVSGLCVTLAAPIAALSCGLFPHFAFYPLMVLGNCALVAGITLILSYARNDAWDRYTVISLIFGSFIKWFVLFLLIGKWAIPNFARGSQALEAQFGLGQLA